MIGRSGVIGEETNRLLMYLIFTSRKREHPLHIISLGNSGIGKTYLQEKVGELIPEEDKVEITTLSENALYYFGQRELKHRLILIEDLDRAEMISTKAAGELKNRFKYNGKEEQREEFSDGSGLEWLDYGARMYDNQVGRWMVLDPKADKYYNLSPLSYCANAPLIFVDPDGEEIKHAINSSISGTWVPKTVHDLGSASYIIASYSVNFNQKTKSMDLILSFNIEYSTSFASVAVNSVGADNPGLFNEVVAHEKSHVDQYFEAAISKDVSFSFGGKTYKGAADKVMTDVYAAMEAKMKSDVQAKIDKGDFKSQEDVNKYVQNQAKSINKEFDKATQNIVGQMQKNILDKYDKFKMTSAQVAAVENNANERATKKLNGKVKYLNGSAPVKYKGKMLPVN